MEQCATASRVPFGDIGEYKTCDMDKETDTSSLHNGDLERDMEQCEKDVEEILNRATRSYSRRRYGPIYEAPEFVKRLNAFEEVTVGSTVVFQCQWKAFPKPTMHWFKDDEEITENKRYDFETDIQQGLSRVIIEDTRKKDEGAYKCKAENQDGAASTTGYLSVTGDENRTLASKHVQEQKRKEESDDSSDDPSLRKVQSDRTVSFPPHLRTIREQKSLEEREEEEYSTLPPSPIQEFIDNFQRAKTWPATAMGYGTQRDEDEMSTESDTSTESQDMDRISFTARELDPDDRVNHNDLPNGEYEHITTGLTFTNSKLTQAEQTALLDQNGDLIQDSNSSTNSANNAQTNLPQITVSKYSKKKKSKSKSKPERTRELVPTTTSERSRNTRPPMDFVGAIMDTIDSPWLYFLPLVTGSAAYATATEMNPFLMIAVVAILSLIGFRMLLHQRPTT